MNELRIGIIDDDATKVTQIQTRLLVAWDDASQEKRAKYSALSLIPVEVKMHPTIDEALDEIRHLKVDCVLIDYRLSSYAKVTFTGIDLAKALSAAHKGFPIFILTSYEDDIYAKEMFDVYQVFNFDRYMNDVNERIELNTKIVEQVFIHRKERVSWEMELEQLLPRIGESAQIDTRILQLDGYIERAMDGVNAVPENVKQQLSNGKIDDLLTKLDLLLKKD